MSKFPQARQAKTFTPAWMRSARAWYGSAFEPKKKGDLAEAMADWSEMDPAERGFVLAHLQYLGLQAQLGNQKMLRELRALFEEVGDEVIEAIEVAMEEQAGVEEEDADEDAEGPELSGPHLELVDDGGEVEGEPRHMPVEAVAPELLRDGEDEPSLDDYEFEVPGLDPEPEGA
jgi:hypothetical protein